MILSEAFSVLPLASEYSLRLYSLNTSHREGVQRELAFMFQNRLRDESSISES